MKVAYEEKFIVINKKHLSALSVKEISELARLIDKIPSDNKYYVCNQDEPYADKVLDIILSGEDEKSKRTFPGPGEYCTGQQWVDAGGSWEEFVEAHKAAPKAEFCLKGMWWGDYAVTVYDIEHANYYRLRLNGKGGLPKPEEKVICANCKKAVQKAIIEETYYFCCDDCVREGAAKLLDTEYVKIRKKRDASRSAAEILKDIDNVISIQCSDGNWNANSYMHGMANGMKMIKSIIDGKDPEFLDPPKEWLCDKNKSKCIKGNKVNLCDSCRNRIPECRPKNVIFGDGNGNDNICACDAYKALKVNDWVSERAVPLINPLLIPLGWWVAMDEDGYWCGYPGKPHLGSHDYYHHKTQIYLGNKIDWQGDWKDSLFSRKEILERWKQEYGDRWLEVAEGEE